MARKAPPGWKNRWKPGEKAYFEYHCEPSHKSCDAELWYRSQQPVTIVRMVEPGDGIDLLERFEIAAPRYYRIRFEDGFEHDAVEDELWTHPRYFTREFAPGKRPKTT